MVPYFTVQRIIDYRAWRVYLRTLLVETRARVGVKFVDEDGYSMFFWQSWEEGKNQEANLLGKIYNLMQKQQTDIEALKVETAGQNKGISTRDDLSSGWTRKKEQIC